MKKIEFSKEDCEKIVDMYKSGISAVKIGKEFGCSKNPIKRVLNEHGIELDNVLRKIPKSEYQNVIDLYNSGKTQREIANIYGCDKQAVCAIMKTMDVKVRSNGFTNEDAKEMYKLYVDGKTLQEIANVYNINRHTVGRVLKRNGFEIDRKTYHCDEYYFDKIDDQDKAYIIGLLWADGYNNEKIGKITLQLQERDKKILEDISDLLHSDMPLWFLNLNDKNPNWSNTYTLSLRSKHISNILTSYGMIQRKSLLLTFPEWLDKSLYSHFIRGYMDGDGSVYYSKDRNVLRVEIVGTKMFLDVVRNICAKIGVKTNLYHKNNQNSITYKLYTTSNSGSLKFLNWIYNNANLKFQRKYEKYIDALESYNINNSLAG